MDLRVGWNETAAGGFNGGVNSLHRGLNTLQILAGDDVAVTCVLVTVHNFLLPYYSRTNSKICQALANFFLPLWQVCSFHSPCASFMPTYSAVREP